LPVTSQAPLRAPVFCHGALLYAAPDDFCEAVREFAQAGDHDGEPVLIASAGLNLRILRPQLAADGMKLAWSGLPNAGINPRRITAAIRAFADDHAGQAIRVVQEPAWHLLPPDELREAVRHEALVNLALGGTRAAVLCGYDARLEAGTLPSAQRAHPVVAQDGRWQLSHSYDPNTVVPPECDPPLSSPPEHAAAMVYRHDQAAVRHFAAEHAHRAGLSAERVTDVILAVSELAGNTLVHTSGPGTLTVWATGNEIICQVHDGGHLRNPLAGTRRHDPDATGAGSGLWVAHQLCDLAEIRTGTGGTTIRLHFRLT
jgi:anti-sigma regulatory factor (Ser/Thr protein kinase)